MGDNLFLTLARYLESSWSTELKTADFLVSQALHFVNLTILLLPVLSLGLESLRDLVYSNQPTKILQCPTCQNQLADSDVVCSQCQKLFDSPTLNVLKILTICLSAFIAYLQPDTANQILCGLPALVLLSTPLLLKYANHTSIAKRLKSTWITTRRFLAKFSTWVDALASVLGFAIVAFLLYHSVSAASQDFTGLHTLLQKTSILSIALALLSVLSLKIQIRYVFSPLLLIYTLFLLLALTTTGLTTHRAAQVLSQSQANQISKENLVFELEANGSTVTLRFQKSPGRWATITLDKSKLPTTSKLCFTVIRLVDETAAFYVLDSVDLPQAKQVVPTAEEFANRTSLTTCLRNPRHTMLLFMKGTPPTSRSLFTQDQIQANLNLENFSHIRVFAGPTQPQIQFDNEPPRPLKLTKKSGQ